MKSLIIPGIFLLTLVVTMQACGQDDGSKKKKVTNSNSFTVVKSDEEWKKILPAETYEVTRKKGTEAAFSGKYNKFYKKGTYLCYDCKSVLFSSDYKFDSGTGWPSFYNLPRNTHVKETPDNSHGMHRTEVICGVCGAHLGHVFSDGPKPTGLRYCINSVALDFRPSE